MPLRDRWLALERELNTLSFEREEIIRGLILALLAREHVFVLGPPGADKSRLLTEFMNRIEGLSSFVLLLTRFTTPEEVMGPVSIPALEQGFYARITDGMLPEADLAFLDEIFKANSAILNALLMLVNERTYRNAGKIHEAPLCTLLAASNELPQADELGPLYDRLLLRYEVSYLAEEKSLRTMLEAQKPASSAVTSVNRTDVEEAQLEAKRLPVPDEIIALMLRIRSSLKQAGLSISDRRLKASLRIVKVQAWLEDHPRVLDEDLEVLAHIFWTEPKDRRLVTDRVLQHTSPATARALEIRDLAEEQRRIALEKHKKSETETAEAMTKLKSLVDALTALHRDLALRGAVPAKVDRALKEVQTMRRQVLRECLGIEV